MANQDRVNFVWAESALTTIPPIPVSEVAYRDTTQTPEQMEVGQQYDTIYNSARHNQLLFLLTSVAKTLCENGIMPFLAGQEYSQYARCIFTDGKLYTASRAILANEQPYPTPGDDSGVWTLEETGENLVPNSRRVIAGTGLTGGGPLSADVTLAVKLTDSVATTDSARAASATAVKTAYDAAKSKLPLAGGVLSGSIQINDPENVIGTAPSTNTERGMFLGDKNSVIMGGFDVIQRASDNAKYTQFYSKNSRGDIASLAAVTYEDGTRELVADSPLQINDIQIKQVVDGGNRVIVLSGARGNQGHSFRFSPDTGEAYMDGRVIHAKADSANSANCLRRSDGVDTLWNWAGQPGQPPYVWGSNDGINMLVWNPANFSVAYASSAGSANMKVYASWHSNTAETLPAGGTWIWIKYANFPDRSNYCNAGTAAGGTWIGDESGIGGKTSGVSICAFKIAE